MNVTMNGRPVTVHGNTRGWYDVECEGKRMKVRRAALEYNGTDVAQTATPTPNSNEEQTAMSVQTETTSKKRKTKKAASKTKKTAAPKTKKTDAPKTKANGEAKSITRATESGKEYTYHYAGKTNSGAVAYDCGDEAAKMLRGKTIDEVYTIVAKAMIKGELKGDFAGCTTADGVERKLRAGLKDANIGRQRMTLGNRLRAALRK